MRDVFQFVSAVAAGEHSQPRISKLHFGAIIILSWTACVIPIEFFVIELWPRHGFSSLLLVLGSILAAGMVTKLLPEPYYRIRTFESGGRIYELLGVRFFKRFVPKGDYINQSIRQYHPGYKIVFDEKSIVRFEAGTRLAERLHVGAFVLSLPCFAYALLLGWNGFAVWLIVPNLAFHVYPVLLQRYSRGRIQTILDRRNRKGQSKLSATNHPDADA
jgi:hypothetical protein